MSAWAEVDNWARTTSASRSTAARKFETFAELRWPTDSCRRPFVHRHDRRFLVLDDTVRSVRRRAYGLRSRGWRRTGTDASRRWLEAHANGAWEGVSCAELLVALDKWLEAGSPKGRGQWHHLTPWPQQLKADVSTP